MTQAQQREPSLCSASCCSRCSLQQHQQQSRRSSPILADPRSRQPSCQPCRRPHVVLPAAADLTRHEWQRVTRRHRTLLVHDRRLNTRHSPSALPPPQPPPPPTASTAAAVTGFSPSSLYFPPLLSLQVSEPPRVQLSHSSPCIPCLRLCLCRRRGCVHSCFFRLPLFFSPSLLCLSCDCRERRTRCCSATDATARNSRGDDIMSRRCSLPLLRLRLHSKGTAACAVTGPRDRMQLEPGREEQEQEGKIERRRDREEGVKGQRKCC